MPRPKDPQRLKAIETFDEVKRKINALLETQDAISILTSKVYIVPPAFYYDIMRFQELLDPYYDKQNKKNSIYSVHKIVNIVNPDKFAATYSFSIVKKSSIIKDQGKIIDLLDKEKEISKNYILKLAREQIENEDMDEFVEEKVMNEAYAKIEEEEENYQLLKENPDNYVMQFTSPPLKYGQINWVYKNDKGRSARTNKHISKELPNIFILDESIEFDGYISSNKTDRFLKEAKHFYGRIYAKHIK